MTNQTFSIGDRVHVAATNDSGKVFKTEGEGSKRLYWIDRGLTIFTPGPGHPDIGQRKNADGAFDAIGPYTAAQLKHWR